MSISRKLLTLPLALVLALGMTAAAFAAEDMSYTDVTSQNWYYGAVAFVTENNLMDGLTETAFGPSQHLTRQMLATALYRLAGSPEVTAENPFTDVDDDAAYLDAVVWAYSEGVVNGMTDTTFSPDSTIERQAIAAMLARYLDASTTEEDNLSSFTDASAIRDYAKGALSWAVANELVQGNPDGTVNPRGNATRAQAATILQRFAALAGDKAPGVSGSDTPDSGSDTPDSGSDAPDSGSAPDVEDGSPESEQKKLQASADQYVAEQEYEKAAECYRNMQKAKYISNNELGEKLFSVAYEANKQKVYDVSAKLLEEASSKGSAAATNELGGSYLVGAGVVKDEKKALTLYKKASEMGSASATYNVGVCYAYGYGTTANEKTAFQWLKKAAEADSPSGMYATGAWYAAGTGTKADKKQAISWLEKYMETGNQVWAAQAQALLEELKGE